MPNVKPKPSPLVYLYKELGLTGAEWSALSDVDKEWFKRAAEEEMRTLGLL
jgi:hypothetical protein